MAGGFLIDMDGVIYRGGTLVPGAAEFLMETDILGGVQAGFKPVRLPARYRD